MVGRSRTDLLGHREMQGMGLKMSLWVQGMLLEAEEKLGAAMSSQGSLYGTTFLTRGCVWLPSYNTALRLIKVFQELPLALAEKL